MVDLSVRSIAASCLDVTGDFSVSRGVYGYIHGPVARELRLRRHLELVSGEALNLSLILVAHEPDYSGQFTQANCQTIQAAIDRMRELYSQVNLGVRKLYWQYIPVADANGHSVVNGGEATDLTNEWSGANDGIDVFYVTSVTDADGWSNSDGPCDKDDDDERTGVVLELYVNNADLAGILLAHEVGHYLLLGHASDITNVMGDDSDGDGVGSIDSTSVNLTNTQGNTMKTSCFVKSPC